MATALTASFILKLEDQLSSGIVALSKKLEALSKLGRQVSLSGLDAADRVLDKVGASADGAARKVEGIGRQARSTLRELKALTLDPIRINTGGTAFLPTSLTRAMFAATVVAAAAAATNAAGSGGGAGLRLPPPSASFGGPGPLLLGGPGGIPLAGLSPFSQGVMGGQALYQRMAAGARAARTEIAGLAGQTQALNHHMRELGEGALVAAGTGFGLMHPISEYAKQENILRHIAITEGVARPDISGAVAGMDREMNALALATGQRSEKIAESATFLITTGIGKAAVDEMLPIVAKAATAYNSKIEDSVQAVFTLKENLKVAPQDMAATVSAMALAGKEGHFSFADMSRFLPEIAPQAALAGLKGSAGARDLMALLETSRRSAGTSGEAATNVRSFLGHLYGGEKRGLAHEFALQGVNLHKLELDAERKGISVPEAVLEQVRRMTAGKSDVRKGQIMGSLFHNEQERTFVMGAMADLDYLQRVREKLRGADAGTIDSDFAKAADAAQVQLQLLEEKLLQVERRFGVAFAVLLGPLNSALTGVLTGLDAIDAKYNALFGPAKAADRNPMGSEHSHLVDALPGSIVTSVLGYVAGMLALAGALGLLIPLLKVVRSGFMVLATPVRWLFTGLMALGRIAAAVLIPLGQALLTVAAAIGAPFELGALAVLAVVAAIAGSVYLIYENWSAIVAWFAQLWAAVKQVFFGFVEFTTGVLTGDMQQAAAGLRAIWDGLVNIFWLWFQAMTRPFLAFVEWLQGTWLGGPVTAVVNGFKAAWEGLTGFFSALIDRWTAPFDRFIDGIKARIAQLKAAAGFGGPEPGADGKPVATPEQGPPGSPIAPRDNPFLFPSAYRPGGGAQSDMGLNINIKVDQDGRVVGVSPSANDDRVRPRIDRGDIGARA